MKTDLPTLSELLTGPFRCRCGVAIDHWGACEPCSMAAAKAEYDQRMRPARESIPEAFRWASFAHGETSLLEQRLARESIRAVAGLRAPLPRNVALVGPSGAGKTSLACALLKRVHDVAKVNSPSFIVDAARSARFVTARDLDEAHAKAKSFSTNAEAAALLSMARSVALLVVDNVEPGKLESGVGHVLMDRFDTHRPCTVITTWMSFDEASKEYGAGWARRVYETEIKLIAKGDSHVAA